MTEIEQFDRKIGVVGEDEDLLVTLIARTPSNNTIYSFKSGKQQIILFLHAMTDQFVHGMTGCDTLFIYHIKSLKLY